MTQTEMWPQEHDDTGDRQTWRTPQRLFDGLHHAYRFTLDAAASRNTAKVPRFWTLVDDALSQDWGGGERIWCNPPYADPMPWVRCAIRGRSSLTVMLVPMATGTEWWQTAAREAGFWTFDGRVSFEPPPGVEASSNSHDSCLFVFDAGGPGWCGYRCRRTGTVLFDSGAHR